jgi:uncharacterized membrane protein YdfJ with MMPL/SSD domain
LRDRVRHRRATGFALDPDVVVKMLCVGIVVGSLVDIPIVRMVLAPAATAGLGAVNWWTPKPMGNRHESHGGA